MRIIPFIISGIITVGLVIVFNRPWGPVPPVGSFMSPQQGFWQNAEPVDAGYTMDLSFPQLTGKATVYFDEQLIPHVFARNDADLYFIQGYLHAKFRLWQMEFQLLAAGGRLTEILGKGEDDRYLTYDRNMRRLGMVYGAKRSLEVMESDPETKATLDAYTAGVNAYIENMSYSQLPLEYRLLNYKPEPWSNYKSALFLMNMSYSLTGNDNDIEYTHVRNALSKAAYDKMFPLAHDSTVPVIPAGILPPVRPLPGIMPHIPAGADSSYLAWNNAAADIVPVNKPDKDNGSNNWAVNGSKTKSGSPILCNDPHLDLNLPSLWFEMQLHTPQHNVYGVSFPGAPCIVIGFNDHCAWGVTNAGRDVKDYYSVRFKDDNRQEYWFEEKWEPTITHIDTFKIKGGDFVLDTVIYTYFGPVQYDRSFTGFGKKRTGGEVNLALRWKAHDGSNELKTFFKLNRATSYTDFTEAIKNFSCPGQNFVFASKSDEIALWQQGQFPAKWKRQGDFIMPGTDSSFRWQGFIPQEENPFALNPVRGYVASANQVATDTSYPYYLGSDYYEVCRGLIIDRKLQQMQSITPADMQAMQTDNYNVFAEMMTPVLLGNIRENNMSDDEENYLDIIKKWKFRNDPAEKGATIFSVWYDSLAMLIWSDELATVTPPFKMPDDITLAESLIRDSAFQFIDNINTPEVETLQDMVTAAFKKAVPVLEKAETEGRLAWSKFKNSGIRHLLQASPLSRYHLTTGGGEHIINATKKYHGPSWRMVVQLTDETEAWGIYPGGQSGNPGSKYYDSFISDWAAGKYRRLWVMTDKDADDKRVKYQVNFSKF